MRYDKDSNTISFADDNEFYVWAVSPCDVFTRTESGTLVVSWNFTSSYDKAVENGTTLIIEDPNSNIVKHQAVTYRTVSRPVEVSPKPYERRKKT